VSSSLRRGALAAVTVAFAILPLAACGAGFNAETGLVQPPNASVTVDDIEIQGVNVVLSEEGTAAVSGRIFNRGQEDQTLLAITVAASEEDLELIPAEGEDAVVVPAGGSVGLGGEGNPAAFLSDAAAAGIVAGNAQALVFDLSETGPAELRATVVVAGTDDDAFAYYEPWAPTPPAEPEADPGAEVEVEPDVEVEVETGVDPDAVARSPGPRGGN
jgi:hypothetical protein